MENIQIDGTEKTPTISLEPAGQLSFFGRSIPENSVAFYKPVFDWLDQYTGEAQNSTTVKVQLDYFNTSSSKCLFDIFKKLENIHKSGKQVTVEWCYEEDDEDMKEAGEDYQSIFTMNFSILAT